MFHIGDDGWLFLTGGTNAAAEQYRNSRAIWGRLLAWRRLVLARAARCRALGARYLHLVAPEKLSVYDNKLHRWHLNPALSPARRLGWLLRPTGAGRAAWVEVIGPMRAARDAADLYHRTDTHWSAAGCLLAYEAVCRACGVAPRVDLADRPFVELDHVLDIGAKLPFPRPERIRFYHLLRDAVRIRAGALLAAREARGGARDLHVGAHAVYRNEAPGADPRRMVLFGDSFAHFGAGALTAMLAETFREVHFIWSANIDWAYVAREKPDLVLFELAERFMARLPSDEFDVDAHAARSIAALDG